MPNQVELIGPFAGVYVGDAAPSVNVLQQVTTTRTEGGDFTYTVPETFVPVLGNSVQNGEARLDFNLTFYGFDDLIMKLAMGNSVESLGVGRDDPSSFAKYTVLLLDFDENSTRSLYIPECYTLKKMQQPRSKTAFGKMRIDFTFLNRNRFNPLYYMDTAANLATLLGGRSPI